MSGLVKEQLNEAQCRPRQLRPVVHLKADLDRALVDQPFQDGIASDTSLDDVERIADREAALGLTRADNLAALRIGRELCPQRFKKLETRKQNTHRNPFVCRDAASASQ